MKIECHKCHATATMEAATVAYSEIWRPYCLTHVTELVGQGEELLVRQIGKPQKVAKA